jgi:hypothetical protein
MGLQRGRHQCDHAVPGADLVSRRHLDHARYTIRRIFRTGAASALRSSFGIAGWCRYRASSTRCSATGAARPPSPSGKKPRSTCGVPRQSGRAAWPQAGRRGHPTPRRWRSGRSKDLPSQRSHRASMRDTRSSPIRQDHSKRLRRGRVVHCFPGINGDGNCENYVFCSRSQPRLEREHATVAFRLGISNFLPATACLMLAPLLATWIRMTEPPTHLPRPSRAPNGCTITARVASENPRPDLLGVAVARSRPRADLIPACGYGYSR